MEHHLFSLSKHSHIVRIKHSTEFCVPASLPMTLGGCRWCFPAAEVWDIPDSLWLRMPSDGTLMRPVVVEKERCGVEPSKEDRLLYGKGNETTFKKQQRKSGQSWLA